MMDLSKQFGVFRMGELRLAVPLDHLKEVLPYRDVAPMPGDAACCPGAVNLRGTAVPLINPAILLSLNEASESPSIIIVIHVEGYIYGLLGHNLEGVLDAPESGVNAIGGTSGVDPFLCGSFLHPDEEGFVNLIDVASILDIAGLPRVKDVVSDVLFERQLKHKQGQPQGQSQHLMLFSVGPMLLTMETSSIVATLLNPAISPAVAENALYVGDIHHAGKRIPAVVTSVLLGLEVSEVSQYQAFILKVESGHIAFLVDRIIDVVSGRLDDQKGIPQGTFPAADLFSGVQRAVGTFEQVRLLRDGLKEEYCLVLDVAALANCPALQELAQLSKDVIDEGGEVANQGSSHHVEQCDEQALVYDAGMVLASSVRTIREIIPLDRKVDLYSTSGYARGLRVVRGLPVPVFCLNALLGYASPVALTATSSILIVEHDGQVLGFMVPELFSIGEILWNKPARADIALDGTMGTGVIDTHACWGVIKVINDQGAKTCTSLDLEEVVRQVVRLGESRHGQYEWIVGVI